MCLWNVETPISAVIALLQNLSERYALPAYLILRLDCPEQERVVGGYEDRVWFEEGVLRVRESAKVKALILRDCR